MVVSPEAAPPADDPRNGQCSSPASALLSECLLEAKGMVAPCQCPGLSGQGEAGSCRPDLTRKGHGTEITLGLSRTMEV